MARTINNLPPEVLTAIISLSSSSPAFIASLALVSKFWSACARTALSGVLITPSHALLASLETPVQPPRFIRKLRFTDDRFALAEDEDELYTEWPDDEEGEKWEEVDHVVLREGFIAVLTALGPRLRRLDLFLHISWHDQPTIAEQLPPLPLLQHLSFPPLPLLQHLSFHTLAPPRPHNPPPLYELYPLLSSSPLLKTVSLGGHSPSSRLQWPMPGDRISLPTPRPLVLPLLQHLRINYDTSPAYAHRSSQWLLDLQPPSNIPLLPLDRVTTLSLLRDFRSSPRPPLSLHPFINLRHLKLVLVVADWPRTPTIDEQILNFVGNLGSTGASPVEVELLVAAHEEETVRHLDPSVPALFSLDKSSSFSLFSALPSNLTFFSTNLVLSISSPATTAFTFNSSLQRAEWWEKDEDEEGLRNQRVGWSKDGGWE